MTATIEPKEQPKRKFVVRKGRHNEPVREGMVANPAMPDDPFGHRRMAGRVKTYTEGETVESDVDLIAKFPGKFREAEQPKQVSDERKQAVTDLLRTSAWQEEDRDYLEQMDDAGFERTCMRTAFKQGDRQGVQSALGLDVTGKFPVAYDNQYLVFVNQQSKHQIVKKGASTKPINKQPLEEARVEEFITDLLKQ